MASLLPLLLGPLGPLVDWLLRQPVLLQSVNPLVEAASFVTFNVTGRSALVGVPSTDTDPDFPDFPNLPPPNIYLQLFDMVEPVIMLTIYAYFFKSKVTEQRDFLPNPLPEQFVLRQSQFRYGTCACCDDAHYCLHTCVFPVNAADVFNTVGAAAFWPVFSVYAIIWVAYKCVIIAWKLAGNVDAQTSLWAVASIPAAAIYAQHRQTLRARLGDPVPDGHIIQDFFCYWFCFPCTVIQDARQLDGAMGVKLECCCKLQTTVPPIVAANPVQAVQALAGTPVAVEAPLPAPTAPPPAPTSLEAAADA